MCSLLDETKAISIPEKKAENKSDKMIAKRLFSGPINVCVLTSVIVLKQNLTPCAYSA